MNFDPQDEDESFLLANLTYVDPVEEDVPTLNHGASSVMSASFNLSKSIVGAGLFGLPRVFYRVGFFASIALIVALALLINWTLSVLLSAGLKAKTYSYAELMNKCFNKNGSLMYSLFAFLSAFGGMCAYTLILGDTVPVVLNSIFKFDELSALTDRRVVIFICSFFIMLPISSVRTLTALARFSVLALVGIVMIALIIVFAGVNISQTLKGHSTDLFTVIKIRGLSGAIGTLCFAYVCHHNTFLVFKSLRYPTMKNFERVNNLSLGYAMLMSLLIGATGYVIFVEKAQSNVLNCFDNFNGLVNFARALFALDMLVTYPLELFVARNTISGLLCGHGVIPNLHIHMILTFLLVASTTIIGFITCDLGLVFELTGGIVASMIAFVFPSACTIKLRGGRLFQKDNYSHILCISFGTFVMVLTTISSIIESLGPDSSIQCKFIHF